MIDFDLYITEERFQNWWNLLDQGIREDALKHFDENSIRKIYREYVEYQWSREPLNHKEGHGFSYVGNYASFDWLNNQKISRFEELDRKSLTILFGFDPLDYGNIPIEFRFDDLELYVLYENNKVSQTPNTEVPEIGFCVSALCR